MCRDLSATVPADQRLANASVKKAMLEQCSSHREEVLVRRLFRKKNKNRDSRRMAAWVARREERRRVGGQNRMEIQMSTDGGIILGPRRHVLWKPQQSQVNPREYCLAKESFVEIY